MKKLIALLMVCGFAFAVVACGGKTENAENAQDSAAVEAPVTPAPADTTAADTTATDTTAAQ